MSVGHIMIGDNYVPAPAPGSDFPNHNIDMAPTPDTEECAGGDQDTNFYFQKPMLTPFP